jgi:superfamily II DNA or RNA helicase
LDYYPVAPIDFYELLQAKVRIKDELHLSLHANFVEELYLHGAKSFSLSATLEDGSFRDKILAIMFPHEMRAPASELAKYISCTALFYSLNQPDKAEYTLRGQTDYNHNQYEKWILKDKKRLFNYLSIASDWVNHRFIKVRQEGQRAAIFATSVDMATQMLEFLKRSHPDLKIARYAASAGDVYEEARKADLLITTVQSFGTGFDLDGLICCLMTSSINSRNTNIQVLGRLRELRKWPDLVPVFDYLVCVDIPKQMAYHEEKMNQFEGRVKDHKTAYIKLKV